MPKSKTIVIPFKHKRIYHLGKTLVVERRTNGSK